MSYDRKKFTDQKSIIRQRKLINEQRIGAALSEYADDFVGIINDTRQFVMFNNRYFGGNPDISRMIGQRPGSIFNCIHEGESECGCGNAEACVYCGAINTVVEAIEARSRVTHEGRLLVESPKGSTTLNVRVTAVPVELEDELFLLLFVKDISFKKQSELFERAFFHDVLNTSSSLKSLIALSKVSSDVIPDADRTIQKNISDIVEQIHYFQKLKMAEEGSFVPDLMKVEVADEIRTVCNGLENTSYGTGKRIVMELPEDGVEAETDKVLYRRIVLNLVKNALEASEKGDEITVSLENPGDVATLRVRNPAVMSAEIKNQVFQRSFSTKGDNRGIGTFSVKLLGEGALKGRVYFSSDKKTGTVFSFEIPLYNS